MTITDATLTAARGVLWEYLEDMNSDHFAVRSEARTKCILAILEAAEREAWQDMTTCPKDRLVFVFAPGAPYDLPDMVSLCKWHDNAGFCVDELREPTHWRHLPVPPQGPPP